MNTVRSNIRNTFDSIWLGSVHLEPPQMSTHTHTPIYYQYEYSYICNKQTQSCRLNHTANIPTTYTSSQTVQWRTGIVNIITIQIHVEWVFSRVQHSKCIHSCATTVYRKTTRQLTDYSDVEKINERVEKGRQIFQVHGIHTVYKRSAIESHCM